MGLRDIGETLPPGFRFYPSDEELVCHYLYKKIANGEVLNDTLVEIDLHTCEPWQLPEVAKLNSTEWYFFSFRDRKYATGFRTNRATTTGYWKATGKDRTVLHPRTRIIVGMRKTLVFYRNRAPNGVKTGWIMHEFRLENPHLPPKEDWVLCRVFYKSKGENSVDKLSPSDVYDATSGGGEPTSPTFATSDHSPPTDHHAAFGYRRISTAFSHSPITSNRSQISSCNNLLNLPALDRNCLHLSHQEVINHDHHNTDHHHSNSNKMQLVHNSKCDQDEYGFLFDLSFEETNLRDHEGVASSLDEMQFDDDSGLIFHLNP